MTGPRESWSEVLVDLDGHLHSEAKDCLHREGVDACRVCCTHVDDTRVVEPEPEDSEWRDEVSGSARALVLAMLATNAALLIVVISVLTLAGVIPS